MRISDFDYDLPSNLIAQKPLLQRDQSRMMVLDRDSGSILHKKFFELPEYLQKGDILVLNNTKVIPAKAWGKKERKDIEFLFLKELEKGKWEALCRPAKKVKLNDKISFSAALSGQVTAVMPEGRRVLSFSCSDVLSELKKIGCAPLPPYIKRRKEDAELREFDLEKYQTQYAQKDGSIAAPTAGLHFTSPILNQIKGKGIEIVQIRLNVGLATFQPVRAESVEEHLMQEETYSISERAAQSINSAKKSSRSVIAVGTTTVRALESSFKEGKVIPGIQSTRLFIYPGYRFRVVDRLLTNFHLPRSTLLMLVSAFTGVDHTKRAYKEAVKRSYRFYSYGDCMLIL
jgi:S-adenosylmethionine:tRNA ribosyltransferase-isomerase